MDDAKRKIIWIEEGEGVPLKEGEDYEVLEVSKTENRKPIPSKVSIGVKRKRNE